MDKSNLFSVPVSAGELIDKISILAIKAEHFRDVEKLRHVQEELKLLEVVRDQALQPSEELAELTAQLKSVNAELWRIEDEIRDCERTQDFGPAFVKLARAVYHTNDRRSELKRQINTLVGSSIVEEKSYTPYA
jgi:hypothetical protein